MPAVVSLRDVVFEMDVPSNESTAYLNPKTGELITVTMNEICNGKRQEAHHAL